MLSGSEKTVLVVNDAPDQLDMMGHLLRMSGYGVLTAPDGRQGLEVALRERPGLVVSDVAMPFMDGIEMCRTLRAHDETRATPVLLVSANRKDSECVVEGLKAGADDYLEAPFDPTVLAAKVSQLFERHQHEEEIRRLNAELERRVAERTAQLQAANRELEAFSYSVSHDLRAPLRHINGFSQALLEDYEEVLDDTGKDHLRQLRAASREMAALIDDLLQLSRVTRSEMQREAVNLSETARDVLEELRACEPSRSVSVAVEDGLCAQGDRRLLRVMLTNLLGNAWKFTSKCEAAEIAFGREATGGEQVFYVRDNGAGFDMTYADKLFGAFQRLHTGEEFDGTGIGLATVQRIVSRHGGRVWAEGTVGLGATFYFTLAEFGEADGG